MQRYIQPFSQSLTRLQEPRTLTGDYNIATQVLNEVDLGIIPTKPTTLSTSPTSTSAFTPKSFLTTLKESATSVFDKVTEFLKSPFNLILVVALAVGGYYLITNKGITKKNKR